MRKIYIKVCGLKDPVNVKEVAALGPDFMGFILYRGSPRHISLEESVNLVQNIPEPIKKVGVLVNEPFENAMDIAGSGAFDILQLHGSESVSYCERLHYHIEIIKTFSISDRLPENLSDYQPFCSMFLFDTAGDKFGGTGKRFDHGVLSGYSLEKDFLLSGGISPEDPEYIRSIKKSSLSGVDLNSRFEVKPGIKDIGMLRKFIEKIRE